MNFYVYIIITKRNNRFITYVGYTNNVKMRLLAHNNAKGAKFTRGNKWFLIYKKSYSSKVVAMKEEYKLKRNYALRSKIKKNYLKNENINSFTL
jgi:putative endonuclease